MDGIQQELILYGSVMGAFTVCQDFFTCTSGVGHHVSRYAMKIFGCGTAVRPTMFCFCRCPLGLLAVVSFPVGCTESFFMLKCFMALHIGSIRDALRWSMETPFIIGRLRTYSLVLNRSPMGMEVALVLGSSRTCFRWCRPTRSRLMGSEEQFPAVVSLTVVTMLSDAGGRGGRKVVILHFATCVMNEFEEVRAHRPADPPDCRQLRSGDGRLLHWFLVSASHLCHFSSRL